MKYTGTILVSGMLSLLSGGGGGGEAPPSPPKSPEISNKAPIAKASSPTTVIKGESISFDGSGSSDDHGIVSYQWMLNGKILSSNATFETSQLDVGEHKITLTVSDKEGLSTSDEITISIIPRNQAPIADAGEDIVALVGEDISLSAVNSSDDNSIIHYNWTLLDNDIGNEADITLDTINQGSHIVSLTVTDAEGLTSTDSINITIHQPPKANAGNDQTITEGQSINFNATNSTDDGYISAYKWISNGNEISTLAEFSSSNFIVGKHNIILTVIDNHGASSSDSMTLLVNAKPLANAGNDIVMGYGESLIFNGKDSSDSDGQITHYSWANNNVILSNEAQFSVSDLGVGEHMIILTVTDNNGATASDQRIVNIIRYLPINDTGITFGVNYPSGLNADCLGESISQQDCAVGRDTDSALNSNDDGHRGFSFTKRGANGESLADDAPEWNCVEDNLSGLVWEVKKLGTETLHNVQDHYQWRNTDFSQNGGNEDFEDKLQDVCAGFDQYDSTTYCNTEALINRVNQKGYCGVNDWRLPTTNELIALTNYEIINRGLEQKYFPNSISQGYYWTSNTTSNNQSAYVVFSMGSLLTVTKNSYRKVRLVREIK